MTIYLEEHPPRIQQFRCPRRVKPSGIIGVHTAESFPDETGPDTGAENVAAFIARRTNYGSYHLLADSDSIIQLVRFECVAYHIGTHGLNEHTIGVSAATQAAKWDSLGDKWVDATVRNMALASAIAARWLQTNYNIIVPARRITLSQALDGKEGFIAHGNADPDRRTDPGPTYPWDLYLDTYAAIMAGEDEDDMTPAEFNQMFQQALTNASQTNGNAAFQAMLEEKMREAVESQINSGPFLREVARTVMAYKNPNFGNSDVYKRIRDIETAVVKTPIEDVIE